MTNTLQDFLTKTEGITYVLMLLSLAGIALFWRFLTGREGENHDDDDLNHELRDEHY